MPGWLQRRPAVLAAVEALLHLDPHGFLAVGLLLIAVLDRVAMGAVGAAGVVGVVVACGAVVGARGGPPGSLLHHDTSHAR